MARLKIPFAVLCAFAINPVPSQIRINNLSFELFVSMSLRECLVGAMIGFASSLIFYGIEMSGLIVDLFRGQTLAQVLVPQSGERASHLGQLYLLISTVIFFTTHAYLWIFEAIRVSYDVFPSSPDFLVSEIDNPVLLSTVIGMTARTFDIALSLSAPVILILWTTDWLLGFMNRLVPTLQVFDLGLGLKMWLAILIIGLILNQLVEGMMNAIMGGHWEILRVLLDKNIVFN